MLDKYLKHIPAFNIHSLVNDARRLKDAVIRRCIWAAHEYRDMKYLTVYRAMLIALLLPGLVMFVIGGEARKVFMILYMALVGLTFIVELLLFIFQFTRKENMFIEIGLLLVAIMGAFVLL